MAGGGVHGKVVGIAHVIMNEAGLIMTLFQNFILMLTQVGEDTTEIVIGMDIDGIMNGLRTNDSIRTGRAGMIIDIGKGEELGAFRTIKIDQNHNRDSN